MLFAFFLFITITQIQISSFPAFCPFDSYNENYPTLNFTEILCQQRTNISVITRKVLIIPQNYTENRDQLFTVFDEVYEDLFIGFLNESYELSKVFFEGNLSIFLMNYQYDLEVKDGFSMEFFRRIKGNISILPLFCSFINIIGCLSVYSDDKIMIDFNSFNLILFVSENLALNSLILNGKKAFENSSCFSSEKCKKLRKFNDFNAFFQIEPIIDDPNAKIPNLTIKNVKFIHFFSLLSENNRVLAYLVHNNIYGSVYLSDINIENCYFSYGLFYYQNSTRNLIVDSSKLFMNFTNIFIDKYNENSIIDENSDIISSFFTINGFFGHINFTNIFIKNAESSKDQYKIAYFLNNNQKIFINNCFIENISNFRIFEVEKSSIFIKNLAISSSFLQPNSFIIHPITFFRLETFKIFAISLFQLKIDYFLINYGVFHLSDFAFSLIKNLEFLFSNSNFTIENGTIHSSSSKRLFIFDTSTINFHTCYFFDINTNTSLFLLYINQKILLESLFFVNISSKSCIFEVQNINSFELSQIFFKNLDFPYFLSPVPNLPFLLVKNTSISYFNCYRMFYITVKTTVLFENVYLAHISSITGSYLFQFMKTTFSIINVLFEEIFGEKTPFAMFHLSGGIINIEKSSFLNIGWKTNDTTGFFSVDDNANFYFFNEIRVKVNSCVFFTRNLSLHSGFFVFTGSGNLTVFNSFFKHSLKEYRYSMGFIALGAAFVNITKNFFESLVCPNSMFKFSYFQHMNGPIAVLGEAIYSKKKNKRTAILQENLFIECKGKIGGSLAVINYNRVVLKNCEFRNSKAGRMAGSFAFISIFELFIDEIYVNSSESPLGSVAVLSKIESVFVNNSRFFNVFGENFGCFLSENTKNLTIHNTVASNLSTNGNGGFLYMNGFSAFLLNFSLENSSAKEGGVIYLLNNADLFINNSNIRDCFALISGGFLSIDFGENIVIFEVYLKNVSSKGDGGVLIVKNLVSFIAENFMIENSRSEFLGVLYFTCANESAINSLKNISCVKNSAEKGSCIYYESASFLEIQGINISFCYGIPLVFSWSFEIEIVLKNIYLYRNFIKGNIVKIEKIIATIEVLVAIENYFVNSNQNSLINSNEIALIWICKSKNLTINDFLLIFEKDNMSFTVKTTIFHIENSLVFFNKIFINHNEKYEFSLINAFLQSSVFFTNSIITGLFLSEKSLFLLNFDSSSLNISSSFFFNNFSPLFSIISSNFSIFQSILDIKDNKFTEKPNSFKVDNLQNGKKLFFIINNSKILAISGLISSIFSYEEILLISSIFKNFQRKSSFSLQAFELKEVSLLIIKNCEFDGFSTNSTGGVFLVKNSNFYSMKLLINASNFFNNSAFTAGVLYFDINTNCLIVINSSVFMNNKAFYNENQMRSGIAGVIYLKAFESNSSIISLNLNEFINNSAEISLDDIYSSICLNLFGNFFGNSTEYILFKGNSSQNSSKNTSYENTLLQPSSTKTRLHYLSLPLSVILAPDIKTPSIKSGHSFSLSFQIIDCHSQILSFEHESIGNLNAKAALPNSSQMITLESKVAKAAFGLFNFSNIQIKTGPNSFFSLTITINLYNQMTKSLQKLQNSFIFKTVNCSEGEVLLIDKSCYQCPRGTYSSNDFLKETSNLCLNCPLNAFCAKGNVILPYKGYWRRSIKSTFMVQCTNEEACLGYDILENSEENSIDIIDIDKTYMNCREFNEGNLCNLCEFGFGKYDNYSPCQVCDDLQTSQILRAVLVIFLAVVYIIYSSKSMINVNNEYVFDVVAKILINHIQRISIILVSEIQISLDSLKSYINQINYLNLLTEDIFSNDCFLQLFLSKINEFQFYKILITLLLPIIIATVCFLMFYLYIFTYLFKPTSNSAVKKNSFLKKFVLFFLICAFLCYSMLIKASLSLLNCFSLDNDPLTENETFLYDSPNFQCWTGLHFYGAAPTGILGVIVWGFIFPFFLWKIINHSLKIKRVKVFMIKLKGKHVSEKQGIFDEKTFHFFFKDYKKKYYYWECVVFLQKLMLNIFSQMKRWTNEQYFRIFNVIFLCLYFFYVLKIKPFSLNAINFLEFFSIFAAIVTNISTIAVSSKGISDYLKVFFYMASALSNILFTVGAVVVIWKHTKWNMIYKKTKSKFSMIVKNISSLNFKKVTK